MNPASTRDWAGKTLFLAALCVFVWVVLFNVRQPVLEQHAFRQTQTALSTYWLGANGFSLAYQTPVLGAPWSIPFEFPLYQALVAGIAAMTSLPLDVVGRLVGALCNLGVCLPLYRSLRTLDVEPGAAHYANALYLTAPTYLFWSGTFMIEGMALLLTVAAGYYMLKIYRRGVTGRDLALFGLLLALGLLQKVTTAAVPALVGLVAYAWRSLRELQRGARLASPKIRASLLVLAAAGIAFALGYAWVKYTDVVKERNEFGRFLTSGALAPWNYGTLGQRFSKEFLVDVLFKRILVPSTGWSVGLLALVALFLRRGEQPLKRAAGIGVLLFLLPMAIFTNLHFVHDYYQTANLVFLMAALGVAIYSACGLLPGRAGLAAPLVMAVFVGANLWFFHKLYYPQKSARISADNSRTLKIAAFLRTHTPADRPVLVLGYDWSSEIPYYAQRKGLAVPPWTKLELDAIRTPLRFLPTPPAAIVSCPSANADALRAAISASFPGSSLTAVDDCNIYLPRT